MGNLKLTSSAFEDGGEIPRECGYKHGNEEPPLSSSGIPEGTKSLALIMDDPDAMEPAGKVWVHWVVWDILNADGPLITNSGIKGTTDFGKVGYGGPAPPDKRHTYVFKLYALDSLPMLLVNGPPASEKTHLEKAMEGHIIEQATLTGTYAP